MTDVLPSPCTSSSGVDPQVIAVPVGGPGQLRQYQQVRHQVFVVEQGIFTDTDLDAHDAATTTVHLVGLVDGAVVGTVRLWPADGGRWHGDRLAVLPDWRHVGLGRPLVRLAVQTATQLGGQLMTAQIQLPNVRFFQALGWSLAGEPAAYHGVRHQPMSIDLR